jgi:adenosylhomocysteine nucleosidase
MTTLILVALPEELDASLVDHPVVYTGVGISNAAIQATLAILEHQPDQVINYGSAGALTGHTGLLTVHSVCQRDANCEPLRSRGYMLGENVLYYRSFESGVRCGSGNNFVTDPDTWTQEHCDIVDMELWSIAKVCNHLNVPWISRKWVSDSADSEAGLVWEDSLAAGQAEFIKWIKTCEK